MRGRIAEVAAVSAAAVIVTMAISAAVLHAPSDRVFGMAIVGRHHDPFTVMEQFQRPIVLGVYSQPVTDVTGTLFSRMSGPVAAYNWLVLLSFPLSAAAAYLLARHLKLSPAGGVLAAMAYAFSPFHIAHAAYHPQVAQTQWMPLYFLALWRCLDEGSATAVGFLVAATMAVTLSNFYGGLIAAVMTPVALAAYWLVVCRPVPGSTRRLGITVGSLSLMAAAGLAYAWYAAHDVFANSAAFAFPRSDLFLYSAKWWSYLVPPVAHPLLGAAARRVWAAAGVDVGLLEQQVSLGWGVILLGLIGVFGWRVRNSQVLPIQPVLPLQLQGSLPHAPILVVVAVAALVCSLSPERTIGPVNFVRPSAFLYSLAPMFRSYARFGIVVQLMAALLAGIGVDRLRRNGTAGARVASIALVVLIAGEYAVWPPELWRDVLPTTAHRWLVQQGDHVHALDCTARNPESASVEWLTGYRVALLPGPGGLIGNCSDPNLSQKLAANGYTHVLVRRDSADGRWFTTHPMPDGLRRAAHFEDGLVFVVER